MAEFWLKIEKNTPEKPEILEIALDLGIDPDVVFARIFKVWAWVDTNTNNGVILSHADAHIDRIAQIKNFATAMKRCGWLSEKNGQAIIPNFKKHMGEGAKRRASDAERKRIKREKEKERIKKDQKTTSKMSAKCPQSLRTKSGLDTDTDTDTDTDIFLKAKKGARARLTKDAPVIDQLTNRDWAK